MPIKVTCEKCGGVLHAPDDAGGKKGRCPNCQNILPIPFEGSRAPSAFGTSSGFGGGSSPSNPPAGMAFSSPSNPAGAPAFPNADAKQVGKILNHLCRSGVSHGDHEPYCLKGIVQKMRVDLGLERVHLSLF